MIDWIWQSRSRFTVLYGAVLLGMLAALVASLVDASSSAAIPIRFVVYFLLFAPIGYALFNLIWFLRVDRKSYLAGVRESFDKEPELLLVPRHHRKLERWAQLRSKGKLHYIAVRYVAFIALYLTAVLTLIDLLWGNLNPLKSIFYLGCGIALGVATGGTAWRQMERRYLASFEHQQHEAG